MAVPRLDRGIEVKSSMATPRPSDLEDALVDEGPDARGRETERMADRSDRDEFLHASPQNLLT